MKYSLFITSCCLVCLEAKQIAAYSGRLIQNVNLLIGPRNIIDHKESGMLEIRATTPVKKDTTVRQTGPRKDPPRHVRTSSVNDSMKVSNEDTKAQQKGSPSRKDSAARESHGNHPNKTKEKAQGNQGRLTLTSSLLNVKLGATQNPFPAPLNRASLRQKSRVTHNKQPEIRHGRTNKFDDHGAAGFAWVKGPASIQKTAGSDGIRRSSDIKANEQAIVRIRHKSAISLGGHALPGGSITAMVRGDSVGAWVDATTGGRGYMQDESEGKSYKDPEMQRLNIPPGVDIQQHYSGSSLTGSPATVKAEITGPGILSMAAARTPIGASKTA